MERYSRRNHAQRHFRVAAREAAVSPQRQVVRIKRNAPKIIAVAAIGLIFICVKWFFIGFLVGKKHD